MPQQRELAVTTLTGPIATLPPTTPPGVLGRGPLPPIWPLAVGFYGVPLSLCLSYVFQVHGPAAWDHHGPGRGQPSAGFHRRSLRSGNRSGCRFAQLARDPESPLMRFRLPPLSPGPVAGRCAHRPHGPLHPLRGPMLPALDLCGPRRLLGQPAPPPPLQASHPLGRQSGTQEVASGFDIYLGRIIFRGFCRQGFSDFLGFDRSGPQPVKFVPPPPCVRMMGWRPGATENTPKSTVSHCRFGA